MSNQPFDREILNPRERPLSTDHNTAWSELDRSTRLSLQSSFGSRSHTQVAYGHDFQARLPIAANTAGFHGNSFRVNQTPIFPGVPTMAVTIEPGLGWFNNNLSESSIGGIIGLDDLDLLKPLLNTTLKTIAVPAADPANPRIDIVEVKIERTVGDPTSRDVLNTTTGVFASSVVNKTMSYAMSTSVNGSAGINYKTGTPAGVPVAPTVTAGYVKISEILVDAAVTSVAQNKIKDLRRLLWTNNCVHMAGIATFLSVAAGQLQGAHVPPGVNVSLFHPVANGLLQTIGIFAGDMGNMVLSGATVTQWQFGVTTFSNYRVNGASVIIATPLNQSEWGNPATTYPAFPLAVGQPYLSIVIEQNGPNVNNYNWSIALSRLL